MKILYVIPSLSTGGAELQTINQVNYLNETEGNVELLILSNKTENAHKLTLPKEKIHRYNVKGNVTLGTSFIMKALPMAFKLATLLKKRKITDVIAVLPASHFVMRLAKTLHQNIRLHQYYRDVYFALYPMNKGFKKFFNSINRWLAEKSDNSSLFISQAVKRDISSHFFTANPLVLSNSLPPKTIDAQKGKALLKSFHIEAEYKILIPGRLHFKKGHSLFFDAFEKFNSDKGPKNVQVVLAGDGPERASLVDMIKTNNLNQFVTFLGNVENSTLLSLYKCANLVVIPSLHEGFGNVAIEGLMQGSLLLVSNADGLGEIIRDGENGFVFEKGNQIALLDKLHFLYAHRHEQLINPKALQIEFKEKYTLERQMDTLLTHLQKFEQQ